MYPSYQNLPYRSLYASGVATLAAHPYALEASTIPTTSILLGSPYSIERFEPISVSVHKDFVSLLSSDRARIRILSVVDADAMSKVGEDGKDAAIAAVIAEQTSEEMVVEF